MCVEWYTGLNSLSLSASDEGLAGTRASLSELTEESSSMGFCLTGLGFMGTEGLGLFREETEADRGVTGGSFRTESKGFSLRYTMKSIQFKYTV